MSPHKTRLLQRPPSLLSCISNSPCGPKNPQVVSLKRVHNQRGAGMEPLPTKPSYGLPSSTIVPNTYRNISYIHPHTIKVKCAIKSHNQLVVTS